MISDKRCLIVKIGALGDVAQVIPAAYAMANRGYRIDWLCGKSVLPLIRCYSWINPIPVDDTRLVKSGKWAAMLELLSVWRSTFGRRYDVCTILHYDVRYRILALTTRAVRKVALSLTDRTRQLIPGRNRADEYLRIVADLQDDVRASSVPPVAPDHLPPNPVPRAPGRLAVLAPGGARNMVRDDPLRRWPLESYVSLAQGLLARGWKVALTGGPDDNWVSAAFEGLAVDNLVGTLKIPDLLAFYDACDLVVTHDTGPIHLAGLVRCALIGLFGPTMPAAVMPRRPRSVAIWGGEDFACRPCYDGRDYAPCTANRCLSSVASTRVLNEIDAMFGASADARSPRFRIESVAA